MKRNTIIYFCAFCFFVLGIGWLCYSAFNESSSYFLNVTEAKAAKPENLANARLFGVVSANGINKTLNSVTFNLMDIDSQNEFIPVSFTGLIPDTFKQGAEIIIEGSLGKDGLFYAKSLMTKCPSKYKKENRQNI